MKMKKINCFAKTGLVILILFFNNSFAQNPFWATQWEYLTPSNNQIPLPGGAFPQMEYSANMIADQNGNPQFFIYDGEVIDKNGNTIANLTWSKRVHPNNYYVKSYSCAGGAYTTTRNDYYLIGADFDVKGYADVCVLPSPVDCKKYFIFSSGTPYSILPNPGADGGIYNFTIGRFLPFYSVLDVSPYSTGGVPILEQFSETQATLVSNVAPCSGAVPSTGYSTMGPNTTIYNNTKEVFTQLYPTSTPAKSKGIYWAAAPKVGTGSTAYNYVFMFDGSSIYTFKVDASGVNYINSSEFLVPGASNNSIFRSELEVVKLGTGNYQLGFSFEGSSPVNIATVEFNSSGLPIGSTFSSKIVGGGAVPSPAFIHGLEFSPDGSKLVFTNETNSNISTRVNYIASPYATSTVTAVPSIPANSDLSKSQIEIRYIGTTPYMYFATTNALMSLNISSPTPSSWVWNSAALTAPSGYSFGPAPSSAQGMGYSQQETFLLPDQMDGVNYSVYQNEGAACCYFYSKLNIKEPITLPVGTGTYTVTNGTALNCTNTITGLTVPVTFNTTTIAAGNITIPNGLKVTFQNLTIQFAPNTGMIVNAATSGQGGKVVLNASTLTWYTGCGENQLWNGVTLNGGSTAQGSITNSPHAVLTTVGVSQIDHALKALNIKGGAIVQYTGGSKLLDNKIAIEAEAYNGTTLNDVGVFSNAIIKTQSTFTNVPVSQMSYLIRVVDRKPTFRFANCTIIDDNSQHKQLYDGVISNNSAISFSAGTTVSNFRWGVYHTNTAINTVRKITINNCVFNSNLMGAYVGSSNFASINNNTFNVVDNTTLVQWPYGLFLDQSSKFAVGFNTFQCVNYPPVISGPGGVGDAGGLWVRNSNINEANINIIRSNTFTKLDGGVSNMDKNYTVVTGSPTNQIGLRYYCNTFTTPITWQDFLINSGTIDYNQGVGDTTAHNSFSHNGYFGDMVVNIPAATPSTSVHYIYQGTATAYDPIINSPSNTYIFDFNLTTTDKNNCGAGGQRLANGSFDPTNHLNNLTNFKNSIKSLKNKVVALNSQSSPENKETLSLLMEQLHSSQNELIMYYLNDSVTVGALDSATKYIGEFVEEDESLFGFYLDNGNIEAATKAYNKIRAKEHGSNYEQICNILLALNGKNVVDELSINPTMQQTLVQLANDASDQRAYLLARGILNKVNHVYGPYPVDFTPHTESDRSAMEEARAIKNEAYLSSFPNPFSDKTTLKAFVPKGSNSASIVIVDVLGKEIAKYNLTEGDNSIQFDLQDVKGILYYSLFINEVRKETKMMIKQ